MGGHSSRDSGHHRVLEELELEVIGVFRRELWIEDGNSLFL